MANELLAIYATPSLASTVYGVVTRGGTQKYNTSGTPAFEATNTAHWTSYAIFLADSAGIGEYMGNLPAGIAAGSIYAVYYYFKSGGSAASTDLRLSYETFFWDGTNKLDPVAAYAGGKPLQIGDGAAVSATGTNLVQQAGAPKTGGDWTGFQVRIVSALTNTGTLALITGASTTTTTHDTVDFVSWSNGTPTGNAGNPIYYVIEQAPVPSGGGSGSTPTAAQIRQEIDANSTQLAKIGTPASGTLTGDIALVGNGGGLFGPGTVSSVTSGSVFTVAFNVDVINPLDSKGSYISLTRPGRIGAKQQIVDAVSVDARHVTFTVAVPFVAVPVQNVDTVQVG